MSEPDSASRLVAVNRKARFDYSIESEIEVGIILTGSEVKSLRLGKANIQEAYAGEQNGELWLFGAHIAEYANAGRFGHEPLRYRKLLIKKKELAKLHGRLRVKGVTLVPLKLYFTRRGFAKLLLGLAVGKKQHEKRDAIRDRDWKREQQRLMKK